MKNSVRSNALVILLSIHVASVSAQESASPSAAIDFNRDVRPILSNHCFQCHGEDEDSRQAELRLDIRTAALEKQAIVPGEADKSSIVARITSHDPEERMPPASTNKPLSAKQIAVLTRWINEGADYAEHWAFRKVVRPPVPELQEDTWSRNPVDKFILQRLTSEKLHPAAQANKPILIRRLYQDLLGLLPTVTEADQFIQDVSPDAFETLASRLLNNPHYGERWGRHWLDQARYADSNGYTIDGPRIMWPYRDWVINAINQDMPFDQFTIEQLAGDLLPAATTSQRIASAFHRNTMINQEGGVKPDQYRHEAVIDRVNTTGSVWLGLTIGCAQCHSHKFDPIRHDEYYRLYAFFNSCEDANSVGETVEVREDEMFGWSDDQKGFLRELESLQQEKLAIEKNTTPQPLLAELPWHWQPAKVTAVGASGSSILKITEDGSLLVKATPDANDALSVTVQFPESAAATGITAIRLRALPHPSLPANGPGTADNGNFVLTDIGLKQGNVETRFVQAWADHSQPDHAVDYAIDGKSNTGWAINVDGGQVARGIVMNAPHEAIFRLAQPLPLTSAPLVVVLKHELNKNYLIGHFALDLSMASPVTDAPGDSSTVRLAEINRRLSELETLIPGKGLAVRQMVMKDLDKPSETFLLTRGDFLNPDREYGALSPGVPDAINLEQTTGFSSRLDLAKWLVSRDNPLTARVTVNRIWARYFGRGLVETENDFGFQGTPPTHLELLDWLAAEFMESGWSMKHLHHLIVTSATYRQSSARDADAEARLTTIDPGNRYLSRQNRLRVEAEIVRDMAVSAAGMLSQKIGGPGIYLPQPDGIYDFTQNKKDWPTSTGPDRYRRTMYTTFYRSAPYPLLSTFDAPDFSTVCTMRVRSNTPLQSLTVANDPVFTELAQGLAQRILQTETLTSDTDRCVEMFRLCLTRSPEQEELELLLNYQSRELSRFASNPDDAKSFANSADTTSVADLAAWASVARALFNSDEFVSRN
ncbi:MAG: PSD1 and planctomycete cytochrome C domain-containing protein [Planctomycetaceae bacterium]